MGQYYLAVNCCCYCCIGWALVAFAVVGPIKRNDQVEMSQAILILSLTGTLFGLTLLLTPPSILIWFLGLLGVVAFWCFLFWVAVPWLIVWACEKWRKVFGP